MEKSKVNYLYLRNSDRVPVGCVAYTFLYKTDKHNQKDPVSITYGFSVHNKNDIYDKRVARTVAEYRLYNKPEATGSSFTICKESLLSGMMEQISNTEFMPWVFDDIVVGSVPKRVRLAAKMMREVFEEKNYKEVDRSLSELGVDLLPPVPKHIAKNVVKKKVVKKKIAKKVTKKNVKSKTRKAA